MTANVIVQKKRPWSEIPHYWQVRLAVEPSLDLDGTLRFAFDPRFPSLALVVTEDALESSTLEEAFQVTPELMEDLALHIFPDLQGDMTDDEIFELASSKLGISAT